MKFSFVGLHKVAHSHIKKARLLKTASGTATATQGRGEKGKRQNQQSHFSFLNNTAKRRRKGDRKEEKRRCHALMTSFSSRRRKREVLQGVHGDSEDMEETKRRKEEGKRFWG